MKNLQIFVSEIIKLDERYSGIRLNNDVLGHHSLGAEVECFDRNKRKVEGKVVRNNLFPTVPCEFLIDTGLVVVEKVKHP